jgi:hypothetical protein
MSIGSATANWITPAAPWRTTYQVGPPAANRPGGGLRRSRTGGIAAQIECSLARQAGAGEFVTAVLAQISGGRPTIEILNEAGRAASPADPPAVAPDRIRPQPLAAVL